MKKLIPFLFLLWCVPTRAQNNAYQPQLLAYRGAPSGTCVVYQQAIDVTTGNFYVCNMNSNPTIGTWQAIAGIGSVTGCSAAGGIPYETSPNTLTCGPNLTTNGSGATSLVNPTLATGYASASSSPLLNLTGQAWNGASSCTDTWNAQNSLIPQGASQVSVLNFVHSGCSGTLNVGFPTTSSAFFGNAVITSVLQSANSSYDGAAFNLASVGNASAGLTTYAATTNFGSSPPLPGFYVTIAGFTNGGNNGRFLVQASTGTTLTVYSSSGVAETHAATTTTDQPYAGFVGQWRLATSGAGSFGISGTNYTVAHQLSATPNQVNEAITTEGNATDAGYVRIVNNSATGPSGDHGLEIGGITDGTGSAPTFIRMGVCNGVNSLCSEEAGGSLFRVAQVIKSTSSAFATATTAGTCVNNTTAVSGATTSMAVSVSPVSTPGVGAVWSAFVSSAGNVTINECAVATSAGGTIAFNIRVTP